MIWLKLQFDADPDHDLGLIPSFLDESDPRPAHEQFAANYVHGGWVPQPGFTLGYQGVLDYPGDPPMAPLFATKLRDELIYVYPYGYVAVVQSDLSFEVCRMD